jgi:hypothetical protein
MQGWSAHRRDGEEAFTMKWISSAPPRLTYGSLAPCAIKLAHVLFRSTPTDAPWHRALEHDCKICPING